MSNQNNYDTQQHEKVRTALIELRKRVKAEGYVVMSAFNAEHEISAHSLPALIRCGAVEKLEKALGDKNKGTKLTWIYKEDIVTNELATSYIKKMREVLDEYYQKKKALLKEKKKMISAVKNTESINYLSHKHQIAYLQDLIEKEKVAKGYLRPNESLFFKGIIKNLDKINTLLTVVKEELLS